MASPINASAARRADQILPDDPNDCFVPAYDIEDEVQQIRIVVDSMTGLYPNGAGCAHAHRRGAAVRPAEREARTLARGLDPLAAKSMRAGTPDPGDFTAY